MTFLNTIFLAALAATAIPLLLHLLSRQRLPVIPFSSLKFLRQLQQRKSRKIKLRQWILLALRTLAIASLVTAFARPALRSGNGSAAAVEMVLVVDDAVSSAAESRDGQLLKMAVSRAEAIADLAGPYDRLTLIPLSNPAKFLTVQTGQREQIRSRLEQAEPRYVLPAVDAALTLADSILSRSERFNRELYIISGFYGAVWDSVTFPPQKAMIRRFLAPVGVKEMGNVAVENVRIASSILQKSRPIELSADVHNYSSQPVANAGISVWLEGERAAQAMVDVPPNGVVNQTFTVVSDRGGLVSGSVRLEDPDPLAVDNRSWFVLPIADSLNLLAIVPDSLSRVVVAAALGGAAAQFIHVEWGDPRGWESRSLAGYKVLLLAGVRSVSEGAADRIAEFVRQGGGFVQFPSRDMDLSDYSRNLWSKLGFTGARGAMTEGAIGWGKFDPDQPLFNGIFEDKNAPQSPLFRFTVELGAGKGDQTVLTLANGKPMIIERIVGKGRALLYAVPVDPREGDFPFSGIFAPLLFRSVCYTSLGNLNQDNAIQTGNGFSPVVQIPTAVTATLTTPDQSKFELPPHPTAGGVEYRVEDVPLAGIYALTANGRTVAKFSANSPVAGSRLTRDEDGKLFAQAHVISQDKQEIAREINSARYGRELWLPIAVLFLLLLIAETLVGRTSRKEAING